MLSTLFEQFIREKRLLKNVTPKTVPWYNQSWVAFTQAVGIPSRIEKPILNQFVMKMRERGLSAVSCNVYICGINSFLSWLHENDHTPERFKIKDLRVEKKVLQTFDEWQIKKIIAWKPSGFYQWRLYALLCLIIDTGIRIEEALTLTRTKVDFDNLLFTVKGKGNKERIVPMSVELRKVLFRYAQKHTFEVLFPTRGGGRLEYHNVLGEFKDFAKKLGITGVRVSFHTLRHSFAVNYVRNGGNLFYLQKALGHETLQMTRRYTELNGEDLKMMHSKTSLLDRLR
ncbi:MAG TPA: tyrosine-type recombinase/integrase [Blastocatellia bacterium]|nr:tyrosine-type recombinase/integrase [Blastocatellia bacterium]